ncbi:MAG: polyketide synthase [Deltaproteobacteria bacterium]|nr:polyketide synthase [Deltaproteobacteria bacterium]MBN2670643.1 polyketide synthase [Deltaproteobacteria bacterium]
MPRYDIAIVGAGCIFPGADNIEQYWKNVHSGQTFVQKMPKRLWHMENYYSTDVNEPFKTYCNVGAFVENFTFPFFEYKLPPKAMEGIGSAQLVAMEAAKQALKEAGIAPHSKILERGVTVVGCSGVDVFAHSTAYFGRVKFWQRLRKKLEAKGVASEKTRQLLDEMSEQLKEMTHYWYPATIAIGSSGSSISNRLAQVFGVHGFNTTVDAACSSSLVAIDVACQALMAKDADVALAGGTDMGVNPAIYVGFSRVGGISRSGISNPFDSTADGLVIGEGTGIFVLKRLEDALTAGDKIKGVIRGIGSTSDGGGQAIYNPSLEGRADAFRRALNMAEVSPDDVQFIEAHATSTVVGDANEYDSIATVYGNRKSKEPLYLGSVKHQIGHVKSAAGSAGLLKTVLAMEHGVVPHLPAFRSLTPHAKKATDKLAIPKKPIPWKAVNGRRTAAVTTSGFGGINYHLIVERADTYDTPKPRMVPSRKLAIVGAKAKVAGADSVEEFWQNSVSEKDVFTPIDRKNQGWIEDPSVQPENERVVTQRIGAIKPFKFNSLKYKIFPKSVSQISPSQLVALDLADQLLESYGADKSVPKRIGVSLGGMHDDYYPTISDPLCADEYAAAAAQSPVAQEIGTELLKECLTETVAEVHEKGPPSTEHTLPGWMTNITPGRISNKMNCTGPNYVVDSACSSGLASMLPTMYQLMFTDVEAVITGGINIQSSEVFSSAVTQIGAVAEHTARPYDAAGKGFLIGEGGVLFLVKRLEDAVRDNDDILAVVHNISGSSEAKSKTMLAPTEEAIRLAIHRGVTNSGISPDDIGVVDTHGSANLLSDVAEVNAIAAELRKNSDKPPVQVLATKSHIGHLYGGSGASSILSTILSLKNRMVPGVRNLKNRRPELDAVKDKALPQQGSAPLNEQARAGAVNSLGLGGSNYFGVFTGPEWIHTQEVKSSKKTSQKSSKGSNLSAASNSVTVSTLPAEALHAEFADYLSQEEPALSAVFQEAYLRFLKKNKK